jgi:hypothetical protein
MLRPYVAKDEDPVNMVGHHDEITETYIEEMRWDSEPGLGDYATDVTQDGPVVYDLPQEALASECAGS